MLFCMVNMLCTFSFVVLVVVVVVVFVIVVVIMLFTTVWPDFKRVCVN